MRKAELAVSSLLFLTLLVFSGGILCRAQLEWSTRYRITVRADGSAIWLIERGTLLRTKDDEQNFFRYSSIEHLQEFSSNINVLVNETRIETGRDMEVPYESFKITTSITSRTETSSYGIVQYQFEWLNFTETKDTQIILGDAFIEGIFLFGDGELILEYPKEYDITEIYPLPDIGDSNQTLTWHRIGKLGVRQPKITLKLKGSDSLRFLQQYALPIIGTILLLGVGSASLWFFKLRKREKVEVGALAPKIPLGIESDEEKVIKLLRVAGGALYQSAITKELGFSRSKTSKLLSMMEMEGKIRRQQRGREKAVTLIDESSSKSV